MRGASEEAVSHEPSSFEKHAQSLEGSEWTLPLCGLLRLAWNSIEKRVEQQTLNNLRPHPDVERFQNLARNSSVDQLEDLSRVILQEMHQMDPQPRKGQNQVLEYSNRGEYMFIVQLL